MDFNDSQEEAEFRAQARAWLEQNATRPDADAGRTGPFAERDEDINETVRRAKAWQKTKADAGWACITWPERYGGRGLSSIFGSIWNQEEARFDTPTGIFAIGQGMAGPTIMTHGTDEQKDRFLPKLLSGEEIWCQLFSEPAAGSDLAGMRTRAERDGDDWVVNGQKVWTSGAHYSDWGILVARTNPDVPKHKGITYFYVDMKSPGIEIRPIRQITGAADFNEVFFTDVRIPDSQRLSEVDGGWGVALTTLMNERVALGAGGGGGFGLESLAELARGASVNGHLAIEDSAIRQRLADIFVRSRGLKYTGLRILTAISRGTVPGPEASIGKLVAAPMLQEAADLALELQGEAGVVDDPGTAIQGAFWQQVLLGAPGFRVAGGTDEILRNIIGERVLGLPGDARPDKGVAFKDIPTGKG